MEYIEISVCSLTKFILNIKKTIKYSVILNKDTDIIFKPFEYLQGILINIDKINSNTEKLLNEVYDIIRKYNLTIKDYLINKQNNYYCFSNYNENNISYINSNNLNNLIKAGKRLIIYIECMYSNLLKCIKSTYNSNNNSNVLNKSNINILKFKLYLNKYSKCPYTEEYIIHNLVLHDENIYYYRVKDTIFKFFYFYKTKDNTWYWSPPKKTDLEDIWMKCPDTVVKEGYWKCIQIPKYIEDLIIWLDLFYPDLPYNHILSK